jgi:hypothetical protein
MVESHKPGDPVDNLIDRYELVAKMNRLNRQRKKMKMPKGKKKRLKYAHKYLDLSFEINAIIRQLNQPVPKFKPGGRPAPAIYPLSNEWLTRTENKAKYEHSKNFNDCSIGGGTLHIFRNGKLITPPIDYLIASRGSKQKALALLARGIEFSYQY